MKNPAYTAAALVLAATCAYASVIKPRMPQPASAIESMIDEYFLLNGEADVIEDRMAEIERSLDIIDAFDPKIYDDSMSHLINRIIDINTDSEQLLVQARKNRFRLSEVSAVFSSQPVTRSLRRAGYINSRLEENTAALNALHNQYHAVRAERDRLASLSADEDRLYASLDNLNDMLWEKRDQASLLLRTMRRSGTAFQMVLAERILRADTLDRVVTYLIASTDKKTPSRTKDGNTKKSEPKTIEKAAADTSDDDLVIDPESRSFANRKGALPNPVNGEFVVVSKYGPYTLPGYPKAEIKNTGIDIETTKGAKALAVADGTVSAVFQRSGFHNVVMVRHGEFITVYANIDKISVKTNDTVKAGQELGTLFSNNNDKNRTILHFEVRMGRQSLDPLKWIKGK